MDRGLLHTPAYRALPYLGQTVTRRRPFGDLPHTGKCLTVADLQGSTGDRRRPPYSYRPTSGTPDLRPATAARSSLSEPLFSRIVAPTALAWLRSSPGRAWQNGVTANFNGKSREECAQAQWLAFPLLDAVKGAIVKGEHGLPVRERSCRKWFRAIALAAGIPDEMWSMDSRAGGAVEADEAGAEFAAIQAALTHSKPDQTLRYIRGRSKRIASVADARRRARETDERTT